MALIVTNDYPNWTKGPNWVMYSSNTKVSLTSGDDVYQIADYLERSFVLANAAVHVHLMVYAYRHAGLHGPEAEVSATVILVKPDLSEVTLYDGEGNFPWGYCCNALDITAHLNTAGTYKLRFESTVTSGLEPPAKYYHSESHFAAVLLMDLPDQVLNLAGHPESSASVHLTWDAAANADSYTVYYKKAVDSTWSYISGITDLFRIVTGLDSGITYDFYVVGVNGVGEGFASATIQSRPLGTLTQNLSDTVLPTEGFAAYRCVLRTFSEQVAITEDFNIQHFISIPVSTAVLLCGVTGSKVYTFAPGLPLGVFDTPEVDFGYPDKEKTIKEIRFGSEAVLPHTILVYISTDGGSTWTLIGSDTTYLGKTGYVNPWLTSKRFLVRFSGSGLHLYFYELYAIPSGWSVKTP